MDSSYSNDMYKQAFFDASKQKDMHSGAVFTLDMIIALAEMARHDSWPDGRFGDDACSIWGMFH